MSGAGEECAFLVDFWSVILRRSFSVCSSSVCFCLVQVALGNLRMPGDVRPELTKVPQVVSSGSLEVKGGCIYRRVHGKS